MKRCRGGRPPAGSGVTRCGSPCRAAAAGVPGERSARTRARPRRSGRSGDRLGGDRVRAQPRSGHWRPDRAPRPGDGCRAARPAAHRAVGRAGPPKRRHRDQPARLEESGIHRRARRRQVPCRHGDRPPVPGLGVLHYGNLIEIPAADLAGITPRDTATQIREAVKVTGNLVMITGAHA
jgi:hypothetical protein